MAWRRRMKPVIAYVGRYFLPWTSANAKALEAGAAEFSVDLPGGAYAQPPQKYHARSFNVLKARYSQAASAPGLDERLREAGCLAWLA